MQRTPDSEIQQVSDQAEAERIVSNIRSMQSQGRQIDFTKLETFANKLGGNHPITTWMLDQVEALGIDVAEGIWNQHSSRRIEERKKTERFRLTPVQRLEPEPPKEQKKSRWRKFFGL